MKKKYTAFMILIVVFIVGYSLYDYFFGSPMVRITNHSNEIIRVVVGYPGGEKTIPGLSPGKSRKARLTGIMAEGGVFVAVNGKIISESTGYVGPYPSSADIVIKKVNGRFVLK